MSLAALLGIVCRAAAAARWVAELPGRCRAGACARCRAASAVGIPPIGPPTRRQCGPEALVLAPGQDAWVGWRLGAARQARGGKARCGLGAKGTGPNHGGPVTGGPPVLTPCEDRDGGAVWTPCRARTPCSRCPASASQPPPRPPSRSATSTHAHAARALATEPEGGSLCPFAPLRRQGAAASARLGAGSVSWGLTMGSPASWLSVSLNVRLVTGCTIGTLVVSGPLLHRLVFFRFGAGRMHGGKGRGLGCRRAQTLTALRPVLPPTPSHTCNRPGDEASTELRRKRCSLRTAASVLVCRPVPATQATHGHGLFYSSQGC